MASDLIDRKALGIGRCKEDVFADRWYAIGWNNVIEIIEDAPAVDAVEVVRCKDCKHCFPARIPLCGAEGGLRPIPYNIETWYCPLGERKKDAD